METGFDAITHAVESYVSKLSNPFTDMLAEKTVTLAGRALKALAIDLDDKVARNDMSYAAMLMGINLGTVGTLLPHRMQYPIGGTVESTHASGLAVLYPAWAKHCHPYATDRIERLFSLLLDTELHGSESVTAGIEGFLDTLGIASKLSDFGFCADDIVDLAGAVTGDITRDPASQEADAIYNIYADSL
jgi:alcohol dehydrogenase class IV